MVADEGHGGGPGGKRGGEKPPFKLCFPRDQMNGRSDIRRPKIDVNFITPKFYSKYSDDTIENYNVGEAVRAMIDEENEKHEEFHRWPLLSSESYGWWYDRNFGLRTPRCTNDKDTPPGLVHSYSIIDWEDRKLCGLCH